MPAFLGPNESEAELTRRRYLSKLSASTVCDPWGTQNTRLAMVVRRHHVRDGLVREPTHRHCYVPPSLVRPSRVDKNHPAVAHDDGGVDDVALV